MFKVLFISLVAFIFKVVFMFGIIFIFEPRKNYECCTAKNLSMALLSQALALLVTMFLTRDVEELLRKTRAVTNYKIK